MFKHYCPECGEILGKGDNVIEITSNVTYYHPECYRKNRLKVLSNIGLLDKIKSEQFYDALTEFRNNASALINAKNTAEFRWFSSKLQEQLFNIGARLDSLFVIIESFGELSFFKKRRLKNKLEKHRKEFKEIYNLFQRKHRMIRAKIKSHKEVYPNEVEITQKLEQREKSILIEVSQKVSAFCERIERFYKEINQELEKSIEKRKEIVTHQIEEIPKKLKFLIAEQLE